MAVICVLNGVENRVDGRQRWFCQFFTHGKNTLMNQHSCSIAVRLRTILSTKIVQKFTSVILAPAQSGCVKFVHGKNIVVNQRLDSLRWCLRTILSTECGHKCPLPSVAQQDTLRLRGKTRSNSSTGVRFARHFPSCRLAHLVVVDCIDRRHGADHRTLAVPAPR